MSNQDTMEPLDVTPEEDEAWKTLSDSQTADEEADNA